MPNISREEKYNSFKELKFGAGGFFMGFPEVTIKKETDKDGDYLSLSYFPSMNGVSEHTIIDPMNPLEKEINSPKQSINQLQNLIKELSDLNIEKWKRYYDSDILDGTQWELTIKFDKGRTIIKGGSNDYPDNWIDFIKVLSHYTTVFDFLLEDEDSIDIN